MLSAAAILAIPSDAPERLFSGAPAEVARQYRVLAMRWHPDRAGHCAEAGEVFRRVAELKRAADARIAAKAWFSAPGEVEFTAIDGRRFSFSYRAQRPFELGHLLIGRSCLAWLVRSEFADLYDNALCAIAALRFSDEEMRREFEPQLPRLRAAFVTAEYRILLLDKDPEAVLLDDLLRHLGGKLPAVHVAWLMSRSLNLACWLGWARRFHGDLGAASLFVNPRLHAVALLGGWWYSVPLSARLRALPPRSAGLLPSDVFDVGRGDARGDLEAIRALGRELMGDAAGTRLQADPAVPPELAAWALRAGGPSALHDFEAWPEVLQAAFGPRRFVELPVSFDEVYPPSTAV